MTPFCFFLSLGLSMNTGWELGRGERFGGHGGEANSCAMIPSAPCEARQFGHDVVVNGVQDFDG